METIRTVFFDLDGTLTDPRVGIVRCIQHAFDRLGRAAPDEKALLDWIGPPLHDSFGKHLGADLADAALDHYRERFAAKGLYENALYAGVVDTLNALISKDFGLYIVTSKPTAFAAPIARHFSIAQLFREIYGSELDGRRANKADLIAHVLDTEQVAARSTVMVGDRRHDVDGARANNVRCIGALWGYGSPAELAGADLICRSVDELPAMLAA